MVLRFTAFLLRDWMRVVEADQPLAGRPVQRERLVQPVRLFRRHRRPRHHEPDPVPTRRVHHENLSVEVQQHIEGRAA